MNPQRSELAAVRTLIVSLWFRSITDAWYLS